MKLDDLMKLILEILPDAEFCDDNDGQVVIYTNLRSVQEDMDLVPFEESDSDS